MFTNKKLFSNLAKLMLVAVLFFSFTSCNQSHRDNTQKTESGISLVGRYEVIENNMKYIVYREVDGGLFIINTTKDSLETAFYRQQLVSKK